MRPEEELRRLEQSAGLPYLSRNTLPLPDYVDIELYKALKLNPLFLEVFFLGLQAAKLKKIIFKRDKVFIGMLCIQIKEGDVIPSYNSYLFSQNSKLLPEVKEKLKLVLKSC